MSTFLEPVYLNETMMLNCAAYLFKGVTTEIEVSNDTSSTKKGGLSLGVKFLSDLINLSGNAEVDSRSSQQEKLAKKYTTGGLHMSVVDELRQRGDLVPLVDIHAIPNSKNYIEIEAILKPVDFYSIIETLKTSTPLILKILHDFGDKINPKLFGGKSKGEIMKYDDLINNILDSFEKDYLKSSLLEMIMVDPITEIQLGVVDIDVKGKDPVEVKAKLTDGKFYVVGKITRSIGEEGKVELLRRSFLSTVMRMIPGLLSMDREDDSLSKFQHGVMTAKPFVERICQLNIDGPAVRVMAMSVCI